MTSQVGELLKADAVLRIRGGVPLRGEVAVNGAKNSALAIMAGALLCSQECRIRNVPNLVDVHRMGQVLTALGVKVRYDRGALDLDVTHLHRSLAPYEVVSQLRASFFVIGPLLARLGVARVPMPGGCAIGARPVELHVRGLQALGAVVQIEHGMVHAYARKLKGASIYLDYPSVGATETLMMAATLAEGETVIENAAQEPEVVDLANFCRTMGAKIRGAGTKTITVVGVPRLHSTEYSIIPDRIEAGTFMVAAAITRSEVWITPVIPEHVTPVIAKLNEIGFQVTVEAPNAVRVQPGAGVYVGTDIETLPFPGFPTDMQAQFMALLTLSEGSSVVTETVFENRLRHVAELQRLGANIRVKGNHAVIQGVPFLSGAPVTATDLRASAALVLAGLAAQGETVISGLHHLDRGYERLEEKLRGLGADLVRVAA
ncbi:UDP-N-acetylglucosamine 1-carboxyvinyltransferase [Synechococcus sp. C9]|uniref:UDP-N-acetylglucosamine 1-carboxyvinyltransferase n=1 Tax=Synechococcus sp. C9 TaxID=102119 RepID=UPI001FF45A38|nr:UDP-N-acetylglucosamine 1-carboxyvinyltransferase [Synechococcus sp. C9]